MSINLSALMKQRYDTAANWTAQNPTLLAGEIGIESDTKRWKIGSGSTAWTSLTYANGSTYPFVNADIAAAAAIVDTKLATIATAGKVSNSATTAASANTASAIVARDASGNFTAGTITAALTGAASANVLKAGDTMTGPLVTPAGTVKTTGGSDLFYVDDNTSKFYFSPNGSGEGIIKLDTANPIRFLNTGGERLRITSTGALNFVGAGTAGSTQAVSFNGSAPVNSLVIDSSGRLLVGTSTNVQIPLSSSTLQSPGKQLASTDQGSATSAHYAYSASSTVAPNLTLARSRGALNIQGLVSADDSLGRVLFLGSDGQSVGTNAGFIRAASIEALVDGTPGAGDMPGRLVFSTTADGAASPTEALRITNDRVLAYNQPTPATYAAAATLTVADLKTAIITYTGTAATLTLPTGTLTEGGFGGIYTNMAFEWSVINTGAGICTIGAGTAHTIVGSATVAIGASARFASRRTAANTFVSYRLV